MLDRSFQALFGIWEAGSGKRETGNGKLLSSSLSRLSYRGVELAGWLLGVWLCRAKVMVTIMMVMMVMMLMIADNDDLWTTAAGHMNHTSSPNLPPPSFLLVLISPVCFG